MPAQGTNFVVCLIGPPTVTEFEGTVTDRNQAERLSTNHPPWEF